ncbi:MAG: Na+/H+ antiporter subunit E [Lachnospiraceae bacterium]|nr:Na+/H+ antiporter subunit E [Lachnospiraceae bacterium]
MKKASIPAVISTALICFIFWLLISGGLVALCQGAPDVRNLVVGLLVSVFVGLFSARFFIHESPFYLWNPAKLLQLLFYCICIFPIELIKANLDVALRALNPVLPINPGIVKVPVDVQSEYGQAMLANSITLTPGTITMDIVEEEVPVGEASPAKEGEEAAPLPTKPQTFYYIHWINVASEDPKEAGDAIKGTLEKGVRRIFD